MNDIINEIKSSYGILLNEVQFKELVEWFKDNYSDINEEKFKGELEVYLSNKYGQIPLLEEDLGNIKYLLAMLKDTIKSK